MKCSLVAAYLAMALLVLAGSAGAETRSLRDLAPSDQHRVALVIGNSDYKHVSSLDNPKNDAALIARALKGLGFALIGGGPQIDLDRTAFETLIRSFGREIGGADVALFYYAGHGVQARDTNWLVPVSANPSSITDFDYEMIDIDLVLRQMQAARTHLNVIILDACRNNPFGGRGLRDAGGGLAQIKAPEGTLISYATQPGNVARDGTNGDSPYSKALAEALPKPGLDIFQVFNDVGLEVKKETGDAQQPWVSSSPIDGDFYFAGAAAAGGAARDVAAPTGVPVLVPTPPPQPAVTLVPAVDKEAMFWDAIKDSKDPAVYQDYLKEFPEGTFAGLARSRIAEMKAAQSSPKPPPKAAAPQQVASAAPPPETAPPAPRSIRKKPVAEAPAVAPQPQPPPPDDSGPPVSLADLPPLEGASTPPDGATGATAPANASPAEAEQAVLVPPAPAAGTPAGHAPGTRFRDCAQCPEMVWLPPGRFLMGTEPQETEREHVPEALAAHERPRHPVSVRAAFAIGAYDVTRAEYARFIDATGYRSESVCAVFTGDRWVDDAGKSWRNPGFRQTERDPVVCVSWNDASAYAAWLARATGKAYRLPTEAEWEFAARAGTTTARWWGDAPGSGNANCGACGSRWDGKSTSPAGSFAPNPFGLSDMLGNVTNLTQDCWSETYDHAPSDAAVAFVAGDCHLRSLRGAAWVGPLANLRAGHRVGVAARYSATSIGFRVARAP